MRLLVRRLPSVADLGKRLGDAWEAGRVISPWSACWILSKDGSAAVDHLRQPRPTRELLVGTYRDFDLGLLPDEAAAWHWATDLRRAPMRDCWAMAASAVLLAGGPELGSQRANWFTLSRALCLPA